MSNETITREEAQKALEAAQVAQKAVRERLEAAQVAQRAATVAVSKIKADLMDADAIVLLKKATLSRLGGAPTPANNKGSNQSDVQAAVVAILRGAAPNGLTLDEVYAKLQEQGIEMGGANPRANLGAYIARWSKVPGFGVENRGRGVWGATMASEPDAPEVPAFLAPAPATESPEVEVVVDDSVTEVPAFLAPATTMSPDDVPTPDLEGPKTPLPEGFPGREALTDADIFFIEDLTGKTHDQLRRIKGVGATTAREILAALEA